VSTLETFAYGINYLVDISSTYGGNTWSLRLCLCGTHSPSADGYQPRLVSVSDVVLDNAGNSRLALSLRFNGPYQVYDTLNNYRYSFATFASVLGEWPEMAETADVTVKLEAVDIDGTSTETTIFVGNVASMSSCSLMSVTLECEQMYAATLYFAPSYTVNASIVPSAINQAKLISKENAGQTVQFAAGEWLPYLPVSFDADNVSWAKYKLGLCGLDVPMIPAIALGDSNTLSYGAYTERITEVDIGVAGETETAYVGGSDGPAMLLGVWRKGNATDPGSSVDQQFSGVDQAFGRTTSIEYTNSRHLPIVFKPIRLAPADSQAFGAPQLACDGDPATYATLNNGSSLLFTIPAESIQPLGRIVCNSNDQAAVGDWPSDYNYEEGLPAGIRIVAVLYNAPGMVSPSGAGDLVTLEMVNPVNNTDAFADGDPRPVLRGRRRHAAVEHQDLAGEQRLRVAGRHCVDLLGGVLPHGHRAGQIGIQPRCDEAVGAKVQRHGDEFGKAPRG